MTRLSTQLLALLTVTLAYVSGTLAPTPVVIWHGMGTVCPFDPNVIALEGER